MLSLHFLAVVVVFLPEKGVGRLNMRHDEDGKASRRQGVKTAKQLTKAMGCPGH